MTPKQINDTYYKINAAKDLVSDSRLEVWDCIGILEKEEARLQVKFDRIAKLKNSLEKTKQALNDLFNILAKK